MGEKEFYRKKITQTEYRGSTYTSRHDQGSQFLDIDIKPIKNLDSNYHSLFKEHVHSQLKRFLSKLVSEESVSDILTKSLLKKIFKLLCLK